MFEPDVPLTFNGQQHMALINCNLFNFQTGTCTQVDKDFDFLVSFAISDSGGNPIDLTNDTFQMIIKDSLGGSVLLTLNEVGDNVTTGIYIPSPTSGVLAIQITDTDVTATATGVYPYEMTRTDTDSKIFPFAQGTIEFSDRGF